MNTYLILGLVLAVVVPTIFALRRVRPPRNDDERQEELPSLHSSISLFPRSGAGNLYPVEDTAPSILTRQPEWDTR